MEVFTSKIHNLTNANPEFDRGQVHDLVMIASSVKRYYFHYGIVNKILKGTSAIVKTGNRTYKYALYNLPPIIRCNK